MQASLTECVLLTAAGAATTGSNVVGSNRWGGGWGANWNNNDGWGWGWGRGGYSPALYYGTWGGDLGEFGVLLAARLHTA